MCVSRTFFILTISFTFVTIKIDGSAISPFFIGRIINGTETTIEEYPHMISLQLKGRGHMCGGSIISKNWVLTAAHCFTEEFSQYAVIAGTSDHFEGERYLISEVIIHEEYDDNSEGTPKNDIALVRIAEDFVFDARKRSIELYHQNEETKVGAIAEIIGWGETGKSATNDEMVYSDILNRAEVPIISKRRCNELYQHRGGINEGEICAGFEVGGRDSCKGDSGGPLTVEKRLAGVVSWGEGCAIPGRPGVYTETAHFRDWIRKNSKV